MRQRVVIVPTRLPLFLFFLSFTFFSSCLAMDTDDSSKPLLSTLAQTAYDTHSAQTLKNTDPQDFEIEPVSPPISPIATEIAIASLYLASSIPAVGPAAQTITDLTASFLWTADDLQDLRNKNKRTTAHGIDLAIAGLFLAGGIPSLPTNMRTGATISASALWLGSSLKKLLCAPQKIGEQLVDVTIASLFLIGSLPWIPHDISDDANMAASTLWICDSSLDLIKALIVARKIRARKTQLAHTAP